MAQRTYSMCGRERCGCGVEDGEDVFEEFAEQTDAEEERHAGQHAEKSAVAGR